MLPEEIVSMRKAKEETERIMENVRMYAKAGMTGRATEEAGKLPKEGDGVVLFRNAVDYIADTF